MKDRTLLLSLGIACSLHALLLFVNLGIPRPSLASAAASIEVTLVAPPQSSPASVLEPGVTEPPKPAAKVEPEPITKPELEPKPLPELEPELVSEPEPVPEVDIPEEPFPDKVLDAGDLPTEPVVEEVIEEVPVSRFADAVSTDAVDEAEPPRETFGDKEVSSARTDYLADTVDSPPAHAYNPKPVYPRKARRRGQEGTVLLLVEVLPDGRVGKISVENSSGHELLDSAALKAVRRWRFVPAKRGMSPVRAWVRIPVEFSLRD
ncbi:MAG: energy transducer TonB, partial [Candidatus Hydrogenedentota bacterium]